MSDHLRRAAPTRRADAAASASAPSPFLLSEGLDWQSVSQSWKNRCEETRTKPKARSLSLSLSLSKKT